MNSLFSTGIILNAPIVLWTFSNEVSLAKAQRMPTWLVLPILIDVTHFEIERRELT